MCNDVGAISVRFRSADAGLLGPWRPDEDGEALITRYGTLGRVKEPFLLRSDNILVFTSRDYTRLVRRYGLRQEFTTPHCPQQNGMVTGNPDVERAMRASASLREPNPRPAGDC